VEWVDMKRQSFCSDCAARLDVRQPSIAKTRS
jgi:hypothetical protein